MEIIIKKYALLSALAGAKAAHPNEFICLLTGKRENGNIVIEDTMIPPGIMVTPTMTSFSDWMMPVISGMVGTFHSHPGGGIARPSKQDKYLFSKKGGVHLIAGEPFEPRDVAAFLGTGDKVQFRIID
jgi:proteasome lid subunit RPN8/RPN11